VYQGIDLDPSPALSADDARDLIAELSGAELSPDYQPELVVLPRDEGGYALAFRGRAFGDEGLTMYFVDARDGRLLLSFSDLKTQSAIGSGKGVLGDQKKLSVHRVTNSYRAEDELRPPNLVTFDLKGNLARTRAILSGTLPLATSDLASDSDNAWTDPVVVDAHAYAGWVYDYYFKQFGRRGLDGADLPILSIVHPVDRATVLSQSSSTIGTFYLNAFYAGDGLMVYGEGLPPSLTAGGQSWNYLAGGLDVIAHELTHGVTDFSSQLIYRDESGALNEGFSDIVAASAEFYFQAAGSGPLRADYLIGEDVVTPGGLRSLENPAAFGDPDHYSRRYTGTDDNGGVHTNSTIASHAFYLAIEGGVNRTSGLAVAGVGAGRREQIEKVFYRAFTQMLPSNATFAVARAATIQAARDLYGTGSDAVRAVTEAWTAVGVN
jgi:thermolysin